MNAFVAFLITIFLYLVEFKNPVKIVTKNAHND